MRFVTRAQIEIVHEAGSLPEAVDQTTAYMRRMLEAVEDGVQTIEADGGASVHRVAEDSGLTLSDLPENQR